MDYDAKEVNKFNDLAHEWWNINGEFRTLHHINPARLNFILAQSELKNKSVIDVGCGGGILAESMALQGANVTAIDLAPQSIETAKLHLFESNLKIEYNCIDIGAQALITPNHFDILTCMEMLEHVPSPEKIIEQCSNLLKSGGLAFFSTLNRNPKSYALGVIAAEYLLRLVPKGTHEYKKFIKPSELRALLAQNGFETIAIKGLEYNPLSNAVKISNNVDVNYMVACIKL